MSLRRLTWAQGYSAKGVLQGPPGHVLSPSTLSRMQDLSGSRSRRDGNHLQLGAAKCSGMTEKRNTQD